MPPAEKHLNFYDGSIGDIHVIRFSGKALHEFIERHKYRPIAEHLQGYQVPVKKKSQHRRRENAWYDK